MQIDIKKLWKLELVEKENILYVIKNNNINFISNYFSYTLSRSRMVFIYTNEIIN